jgi:hypothetical protein
MVRACKNVCIRTRTHIKAKERTSRSDLVTDFVRTGKKQVERSSTHLFPHFFLVLLDQCLGRSRDAAKRRPGAAGARVRGAAAAAAAGAASEAGGHGRGRRGGGRSRRHERTTERRRKQPECRRGRRTGRGRVDQRRGRSLSHWRDNDRVPAAIQGLGSTCKNRTQTKMHLM